MYLKQVELFGFKSFADKTVLEFGPGIAAVVGPNGCGKSNLVDAVRWALGEQSVKALRGSRMEEIIFSGSETRKPLNYAEVSLTFANASPQLNIDFDEVTVSRRIYRSGESEYYLNKSLCRLKDITELFLDTGIGKELYSVVGQGRVEEIISSKPEDRREIFEEAAGILKYKLRKKEAQRRLEETRENLVRVEDLIFELQGQVEPLQEQAEIARRYRQLKQEADRLEKQLLTYRINSSRQELEKVEKALVAATEAISSFLHEGSRREEQIQELRRKQQQLMEEREKTEQQRSAVFHQLEKLEGELRVLQERESRFKEQLQENGRRVRQLEESAGRLSLAREQLQRELRDREEAAREEQKAVEGLQAGLERFENDRLLVEVEAQQERLLQVSARQEAVETSFKELSQQLERLESRRAALEKEAAELREQLAETEGRRRELQRELASAREEVEAAARAKEKAEQERAAREEELSRLSSQEQQWREEWQGVKAKLQLLREQEAGLSGYYRGVKEVLQARSSLKGIRGTVADVLAVEERYLRAVEAALGGALQYIITDTEQDARQAIDYLKKGRRGWATFLPLDTIHLSSPALDRFPEWRKTEGVIGRASELVKVEPAYRKIVDYLLGSIIICQDLESASRAARAIKYSCRVISLEGDVISPGGAIRGGSLPSRSAALPLGRRKEIEALEQEEERLNKRGLALGEQLAKARASLAGAERQLQLAGEELAKHQERAGDLQRALEGVAREEAFVGENREKNEAARAALEDEEAELVRRRQDLEQQRQDCRRERELILQELESKRGLYQQGLARKQELERELREAAVRLNSCQEQKSSLQEKIKQLDQERLRMEEEQQECRRAAQKIDEELLALAKNRDQANEKLEQQRQEAAAVMATLEAQKRELSILTAELNDLEEQERRWRSRLSRTEKRERQLALDQARLKAELEYRRQRYDELFGDSALLELEPDFDAGECERQMGILKEEMESLGEVNLGAIDELQRLQDRIGFLQEQQEDLKKGELSLHEVLAEIDREMEHHFMETFKVIEKNFQEVFQELFDGGQVFLKLSDPENLLESGIEIIAQPPGKKLQNISLLSTGEKVLTALALIFAILRYKPAPFYLLDEIESSLDDANLTRFTNYIEALSKETQFILITHRKRTMEAAHVLYGVTMPESGVSRLVSLKPKEKAS